MATLYLDTETFSATPIKHGAHRYAEDAEVLLVPFTFDDDPVTVWDLTDTTKGDWRWKCELQDMIDSADRVVIHNSMFDRVVLAAQGVHIPVEKIDDTMVVALMHSLPAGLGQLGEVLGVPSDKAKDKEGRKLIQLFCSPCPKNWKIDRATSATHPEEWQRFVEYARRDVVAMRDIRARLPRWNDTPAEGALWRLDQRVNDRGIAVDSDLARSAIRAFERASRSLAARCSALTDGAVPSATQRQKLIDYLRSELGYEIADLTKGGVDNLLGGDMPPKVRELLEIRRQAASTTPAKYQVLLDAACSDGRLRGLMQFCGAARTGRDAGRIFQPQNLMRPTMKNAQVELGIAAMKADAEDLLFDNVSELCGNAVRGALVAGDGKKLVIADLSNIEGRVAAWLAGEEWKLQAFRDFDAGTGHDLYKITAGRILGKDPSEVTKDERQLLGKVPELACLGPDTVVLTDSGPKYIVDVTTNDLVWDGIEWVAHAGLVPRGNRTTILLHGVEMTPDHQVLLGETWQSALTVATCPSSRGLALVTGSASLRSLPSSLARKAAFAQSLFSAPAAARLLGLLSAIFGEVQRAAAALAVTAERQQPGKAGTATRMCALMTLTADGCATASRLAIIGATTQMTKPSRTTVGAAFMSTRLGGRIAPLISRISSLSMGGISRNWSWTVSTSTRATSRAIFGSSGVGLTATTCGKSETCSSVYSNSRPVFDLAHAGPRNRFTVLAEGGALVVHNCGYQGAVGAFRVMGGSVVDAMSDEAIQEVVRDWRQQNPRIRNTWYALEDAVRWAIRRKGTTHEVGVLRISCRDDGWLRIKLPSGRYLSYPEAEVDEEGKASYAGTNQYTKQWGRIDSYGGKFFENIVQAVARDVFMHGLRLAEAKGYAVVLRVHDELVCEVPNTDEFTAGGLAALMSTNPSWAIGLPLAAAGHETKRYCKD